MQGTLIVMSEWKLPAYLSCWVRRGVARMRALRQAAKWAIKLRFVGASVGILQILLAKHIVKPVVYSLNASPARGTTLLPAASVKVREMREFARRS